MASGIETKPYRRRSFKTKLMLLVALAVTLPALLTCLILGVQLNRQARDLFANGLAANLETLKPRKPAAALRDLMSGKPVDGEP